MRTYEETVWWCRTGRGLKFCIADKKHHELQLIARFRGQETRDFLIRRHTVSDACVNLIMTHTEPQLPTLWNHRVAVARSPSYSCLGCIIPVYTVTYRVIDGFKELGAELWCVSWKGQMIAWFTQASLFWSTSTSYDHKRDLPNFQSEY
jgi:hypothetical protein